MKKIMLPVICFVLLVFILSGCLKRIDFSLPAEPVEFNTGIYVSPDYSGETFLSLEYNGRTYIPYGNLKKSVNGNDVGECLGYYVQEGVKAEDVRIFLLRGDADANFLVRIDMTGFMSQPDFFRAIDTKDKKIAIPDFIEASDSDIFWE